MAKRALMPVELILSLTVMLSQYLNVMDLATSTLSIRDKK